MRRAGAVLPPVQSDSFVPRGGLDELTPPLQLADGACTLMSNFEQGIRGGYRRIDGYERWAGNLSTESIRFQRMRLRTTNAGGSLWIGQVIEGVTSGARAVVAGDMAVDTQAVAGQAANASVLSSPSEIHVFNVSGQFRALEEIRSVSALGPLPLPMIVVDPPYDLPASSALEYAQATQLAEDVYRQGLQWVGNTPGTPGQVVGIGAIGRKVYVFVVANDPYLGATLLQAKTPIVTDPNALPNGVQYNWQWEQAASVVIDGSSTIFPSAPQRMDLVEYSFGGAALASRLYGVTGVGRAFSFDGATFTAINTGMAVDTPTRIAIHKNRLFLAFGASLQFSAAAAPTSWTPVTGAGEINMGEPITAMGTALGSDASSALLVGTNRGLAVLYGDTSSDFNLVWMNREMGVRAGSLQFMSTPLFVNDYGVTSLAASQSFGNFEMATISQSVQRFIKTRVQRVTCSVLVRSKNQYRVFFDDGTGLYFTFQGSKLVAITPVRFDRVVRCAWTTLDHNGDELIVFTSDDLYVYRMDSGRNFDGRDIDAFLFMSFNHMRSPRLRKSFRRATLEIEADGGYVAFQAGATVNYGGPDTMQSPEYPLENQQGALWDELTWDLFVWDTGGRQPTKLTLDGTGKNVSIWLRCNSRLVAPFAVTGVLTEFLNRRLER